MDTNPPFVVRTDPFPVATPPTRGLGTISTILFGGPPGGLLDLRRFPPIIPEGGELGEGDRSPRDLTVFILVMVILVVGGLLLLVSVDDGVAVLTPPLLRRDLLDLGVEGECFDSRLWRSFPRSFSLLLSLSFSWSLLRDDEEDESFFREDPELTLWSLSKDFLRSLLCSLSLPLPDSWPESV